MTPTRTPGADPAPSTLMGAGWQPRARAHAEEIGTIWGDFGVRSEVDPLTAVMLTWPGDDLAFDEAPADMLMHARPDLARMREQVLGVAEAYASRGIAVQWLRPRAGTRGDGKPGAPPNLVFARDLALMTPEGAILARMATEQRAGEPRLAAEVLATLGIPILATPRGKARFEGPDALWVRPDVVMVAVGRRTNAEGYACVRRVLADQGVRCLKVAVWWKVQHLLGTVNLVDNDLVALLWPTVGVLRTLAELGIRAMDLSADRTLREELSAGRAHNFVTLAPRVILMPAGNPRTRAVLEAEGVEVIERDVSEYLKAAGGIGCLTGVLGRRA